MINHEQRIIYIQLKFKTSILKSSLCDYSEASILFEGTMAVANETAAASNNANNISNLRTIY